MARRLPPPDRRRPVCSTWARAAACPAWWWPTRWPEAQLVLLEASARRAAFLRRAVDRLGPRGPGHGAPGAGRGLRAPGGPGGAPSTAFWPAPSVAPPWWPSAPPRSSGSAAGCRLRAALARQRAAGTRTTSRGGRPDRCASSVSSRSSWSTRASSTRSLRQTQPCPERFPRRNGVPAKRPLF